jgi:hypothetical protein
VLAFFRNFFSKAVFSAKKKKGTDLSLFSQRALLRPFRHHHHHHHFLLFPFLAVFLPFEFFMLSIQLQNFFFKKKTWCLSSPFPYEE